MCRRRTTHAECQHALDAFHDEWRDKWGNVHEISTVECSSNGIYPGKHFNADDIIDRDCQQHLDAIAWDRIVAQQAADG